MPVYRLQVTEIEFDFEMEDDVFPSLEEQQQITESVLGQIYSIGVEIGDDEDQEMILSDLLLDEISNQTGWCIYRMNFRDVDTRQQINF